MLKSSTILFTLTTLFFGQSVAAVETASSIQKHFVDLDGCFILYDLKADKPVIKFNEKRCAQRMAPCSTFKVPLALMGFDTGILRDETTLFKWDGVQHDIKSHNQDQTAASWIKNSAVWVSQKIAPQIGPQRIKNYLADFGYGNQDMSGGLNGAWLTRGDKTGPAIHSTLGISADEQVAFLSRLWRGQLHVSPRSVELTKKVTFLETSPKGYALSGKTGSGWDGSQNFRLGWFVAHLEGNGKEFISVVTFTEAKHRKDDNGYAGPEAKEIMKSLLTEAGYW